MNKITVLCLAVGMFALSGVSQANTQPKGTYTGDYKTRTEYCVNLLNLHGTMSRAQFECGFSGYSDDLLYKARQCMNDVGDKTATASLKEGMSMFDHRVSLTGKKETCESALQTFPNILKK